VLLFLRLEEEIRLVFRRIYAPSLTLFQGYTLDTGTPACFLGRMPVEKPTEFPDPGSVTVKDGEACEPGLDVGFSLRG